jgi:uncharacterized LabA/DUF88 family protein
MINEMSEAVCNLATARPERLRFRLYGGWYRESDFTRRAQDLSSELQRLFPATYRPLGGGRPVKVGVELAYAMLVAPDQHLIKTVRTSNAPHRAVKMGSPRSHGCKRETCYLKGIRAFFSKGYCTHPGCDVKSTQLMGSTQSQKLVDTMITADVLHACADGARSLALVSSDDDMVPAVLQALRNEVEVIHLHTGPRDQTPAYYIQPGQKRYAQATLDR